MQKNYKRNRKMVYGYIRVSTEKQTVENQRNCINEFCLQQNIAIDRWISETISGTKNYKNRKLGSLINEVNTGDTIIITELSRLGRSLTMIFSILNELLQKKITVIAIKENYNLGDNIQSQVLAFAFGLSAQLERDLISERTKMGLNRARTLGKQIGRKKGQKPRHYKLDEHYHEIKAKMKENQSVNSLAIELGVSRQTLKNFCARHRIKYRNRKFIVRKRYMIG